MVHGVKESENEDTDALNEFLQEKLTNVDIDQKGNKAYHHQVF